MAEDNEEIKKYPLEKCIENFKRYILSNELNSSQKLYFNNKQDLLSYGIKGELSSIYLRSMAYQIFLNHLPDNKSLQQWISITINNRISYLQLKSKYIPTNKNIQINTNNNSYLKLDSKEKDEEIKFLINLDISRTFQEISLFKEPKIKKILFNVLYIYNMENSNTISYKQGMNEIISILLLSIYPCYFPSKANISKIDIINASNSYDKKNKNPPKNDKIIVNLKKNVENDKKVIDILFHFFHDENYLENDLYYLFNDLMKKGFNYFYKDDFLQKRCDNIINNKLKLIDSELYNHCINIKVAYPIFLGKWLQSFYDEVTNIYNCIKILDIIISQEYLNNDINNCDIYFIKKNDLYEFQFLDCISLSMIKKYREELLKKNGEDFLIFCLKYPEINNINEIIQQANYINTTIKNNNIDINKINEKLDKKTYLAFSANKKVFFKKQLKNKSSIKKNTNGCEINDNKFLYKPKKLMKNNTIVGNIDIKKTNKSNITSPSKNFIKSEKSNKSSKLIETKNNLKESPRFSFFEKMSSISHQFDEYKCNDLFDPYYF